MSQIKRSLGEFDSAGEFLQRVLKIDERNEDALLCLGDLQTQIHALGPARKSYDKIIKVGMLYYITKGTELIIAMILMTINMAIMILVVK